MAQESWNEIEETTELPKPEAPILCANNCGFFGSPMTHNLCSKCYRDLVMNLEIAKKPLPSSSASSSLSLSPAVLAESVAKHDVVKALEEPPIDRQQNRCFSCRRRVGLTGFKCRCGSTFCSSHRFPETHHCSYDYKCAGREAIAMENPLVKADKIDKI